MYGLTRDAYGQTRYRVEYEIRSGGGRSAPARLLHGLGRVLRVSEKDREVSISYEHIGGTTDDVAYVELDLQESNEGEQRVRVIVTDLVSEQSVKKSTSFSVSAPN